MKFPEFKQNKEFESTFRKPVFVRTAPGVVNVIRILSKEPHAEETHYVNRSTIQCTGDDCPICENNKIIISQNPESFRNVPGYSSRRTLYYVNVLDKTLVKECPNCSVENTAVNGGFQPTCWKCNTVLVDTQAEPSNTVKILSRGVEFFSQLQMLQATTRDENGDPYGLENFDIQLLTGNNRQPVPQPAIPFKTDPVSFDESDLFELDKVIISLNRSEIQDYLRGVSLKDIFAGRSAVKSEAKVEKDVAEVSESVEDRVNNLFG